MADSEDFDDSGSTHSGESIPAPNGGHDSAKSPSPGEFTRQGSLRGSKRGNLIASRLKAIKENTSPEKEPEVIQHTKVNTLNKPDIVVEAEMTPPPRTRKAKEDSAKDLLDFLIQSEEGTEKRRSHIEDIMYERQSSLRRRRRSQKDLIIDRERAASPLPDSNSGSPSIPGTPVERSHSLERRPSWRDNFDPNELSTTPRRSWRNSTDSDSALERRSKRNSVENLDPEKSSWRNSLERDTSSGSDKKTLKTDYTGNSDHKPFKLNTLSPSDAFSRSVSVESEVFTDKKNNSIPGTPCNEKSEDPGPTPIPPERKNRQKVRRSRSTLNAADVSAALIRVKAENEAELINDMAQTEKGLSVDPQPGTLQRSRTPEPVPSHADSPSKHMSVTEKLARMRRSHSVVEKSDVDAVLKTIECRNKNEDEHCGSLDRMLMRRKHKAHVDASDSPAALKTIVESKRLDTSSTSKIDHNLDINDNEDNLSSLQKQRARVARRFQSNIETADVNAVIQKIEEQKGNARQNVNNDLPQPRDNHTDIDQVMKSIEQTGREIQQIGLGRRAAGKRWHSNLEKTEIESVLNSKADKAPQNGETLKEMQAKSSSDASDSESSRSSVTRRWHSQVDKNEVESALSDARKRNSDSPRSSLGGRRISNFLEKDDDRSSSKSSSRTLTPTTSTRASPVTTDTQPDLRSDSPARSRVRSSTDPSTVIGLPETDGKASITEKALLEHAKGSWKNGELSPEEIDPFKIGRKDLRISTYDNVNNTDVEVSNGEVEDEIEISPLRRAGSKRWKRDSDELKRLSGEDGRRYGRYYENLNLKDGDTGSESKMSLTNRHTIYDNLSSNESESPRERSGRRWKSNLEATEIDSARKRYENKLLSSESMEPSPENKTPPEKKSESMGILARLKAKRDNFASKKEEPEYDQKKISKIGSRINKRLSSLSLFYDDSDSVKSVKPQTNEYKAEPVDDGLINGGFDSSDRPLSLTDSEPMYDNLPKDNAKSSLEAASVHIRDGSFTSETSSERDEGYVGSENVSQRTSMSSTLDSESSNTPTMQRKSYDFLRHEQTVDEVEEVQNQLAASAEKLNKEQDNSSEHNTSQDADDVEFTETWEEYSVVKAPNVTLTDMAHSRSGDNKQQSNSWSEYTTLTDINELPHEVRRNIIPNVHTPNAKPSSSSEAVISTVYMPPDFSNKKGKTKVTKTVYEPPGFKSTKISNSTKNTPPTMNPKVRRSVSAITPGTKSKVSQGMSNISNKRRSDSNTSLASSNSDASIPGFMRPRRPTPGRAAVATKTTPNAKSSLNKTSLGLLSPSRAKSPNLHGSNTSIASTASNSSRTSKTSTTPVKKTTPRNSSSGSPARAVSPRTASLSSRGPPSATAARSAASRVTSPLARKEMSTPASSSKATSKLSATTRVSAKSPTPKKEPITDSDHKENTASSLKVHISPFNRVGSMRLPKESSTSPFVRNSPMRASVRGTRDTTSTSRLRSTMSTIQDTNGVVSKPITKASLHNAEHSTNKAEANSKKKLNKIEPSGRPTKPPESLSVSMSECTSSSSRSASDAESPTSGKKSLFKRLGLTKPQDKSLYRKSELNKRDALAASERNRKLMLGKSTSQSSKC